jgi:hypothetical protein
MKRLLLCASLVPVLVQAQSDPAVQAARQWRQQHERAIVEEFVTLLSIPNVAADRDDIRRNATAIAAMMARRGIAATMFDHIRKQGFFVVDAEPSADVRRAHAKVARVTMRPGGYNSVRTSMDLPISQEIIRTVERARGAVVKIPNMGAGVPLDIFERALGAPAIVVPIAITTTTSTASTRTSGYRTSGTASSS